MGWTEDEDDRRDHDADGAWATCILCEQRFAPQDGVVTDKAAACHRCMAE